MLNMKHLICSLLAATVVSSYAADNDKALETAALFLGADTKEMTLCYTATGPATTRAIKAEPALYVYNRNGGKGFVVVSADESNTILAYSTENTFDASEMPPACKEWIDSYTHGATKLTISADAIKPLLKSTWGQGFPYNMKCPMERRSGYEGKQCLTGCVPTAIAQVMYYYQYPERPTGSVFYYDSKQSTWRELDFDQQPKFDWENINDEYETTPTIEQCTAVADLFVCVTHASKADFGYDVTLATPQSSVARMADYFDYSKDITHHERSNYDDDTWASLIIAELEAARPVIYRGANSTIGHTFVCDGYDGKGMFHINWGWRGKSDGYYSLSALNPTDQGEGGSDDGYNNGQAMECGIQPASSTGIEGSLATSPEVKFHRNADGSWLVTSAKTITSIELYSSDGRTLFSSSNAGNTVTLPATDKGYGILRIITSEKETIRKVK